MIDKATKKRVQEKIARIYTPLKELIFEENRKEMDVIKNFTEYSHLLAIVEMMIHTFIRANPETTDKDILDALKRIRKDTFHEFSQSDEDALAFAITYGMSKALVQKRLALNEVHALLDWLIHEVEGRMKKNESYSKWLMKFFKDNPIKAFTDDNK